MNQCVRTLYAQDVSGQYTPNSQSAYTDYYNNKLARQELILVGANDGMLHAFHAGNYQDGGTFDEGTGLEVWAFVPPDMVPKLQRYALSANHSILLDGSPWVRDIWKDGSGSSSADRQKQSDEFHTVAIVGEREGGRHYTAIDLTDTTSNPKYLWTWPPPGSNYDLAVGESWNDTTPTCTVEGWRSTKSRAAALAASRRVGFKSSAPMLPDTSKAKITVPSRRGRPKTSGSRSGSS